MIREKGQISVGRYEPEDDNNFWMKREGDRMAAIVRAALNERWPDKSSEWRRWNVIRMIGRYQQWVYVDLLEWTPLGELPLPELRSWWRYIPLLGRVDPIDIGNDPSLLWHGRVLLYGEDEEDEKVASLARHRARSFDQELERQGITRLPGVGTRKGLDHVMRVLGLRFVKIGQVKYEIDLIEDIEEGA